MTTSAWFCAGIVTVLLTGGIANVFGHSRRTGASNSDTLTVCGSQIDVQFRPGPLDPDRQEVIDWVRVSAESTATYFGKFPVPHTVVQIVLDAGERGVLGGTTWGSPYVHTRVNLGEHTSAEGFHQDWVMTHEFVHTAMPQLDDNHHWLEEGLATYVEPIARVQHGVLSEESVWADMIRDTPKGEPLSGDRGLDRTHTWARTYWGGAMFYLVADVRIRQQTNNRKGLQDAMQAMVASGQTIADDGTPEAIFALADKSVGVSVMFPLYRQVSEHAVPEDLNALWTALGVRSDGRGVVYNDQAPLASVRKAIFRPRPACGVSQ